MSAREEILRVLDRYTYLVDASDWGRMDEVLTADAGFTVHGTPVAVRGIDQVVELLQRTPTRPLMHLTTNVLVEVSADGRSATATSKVFTPKPDGTAGLARYEDDLTLTEIGWRIVSHRVVPVGQWSLPDDPA